MAPRPVQYRNEKNVNEPTGAAYPSNPSSERASRLPFYILLLNKEGPVKNEVPQSEIGRMNS